MSVPFSSQRYEPSIPVLADEIVLGRNVLNKLTIFFDSPKQQTEILDDPTVKRLRDRRE
jgi:hypothetical protein